MVERVSANWREAEALAFLPMVQDEADGVMAEAAVSIEEKLVLPIHPFTTTQIPTAMKAPPAM